MAVEIIWDQERQVAAMYCTTSDTAFGPVFTGPAANVEVGEFLDWLRENEEPVAWTIASPQLGDGKDPRDYTADELERIVKHWRLLVEDGDAG